ncbi:MAG TPA: transposase [Gemmataceae bacterium]|nr:transposase [Gemmataceae bacterium]
MASIADTALPLLPLFAPAFTPATFRRAQLLAVACILTTGRRTVSNLLRTAGRLAVGAPSSYHRVLSQARWSGLRLAALLSRFLIGHCWPAGTIPLVGDDTVSEHRGQKVHGKARHRDPVRSSHSYTAWRWGHKWVALAVRVRFPFASRPWALPVLVALYRSPEDNRRRGRPHRTPAQLLQLLLRVLLRWFPDRHFVVAGDQNYGSHEMASLAPRTHNRLHVVSKPHPNANLYEPPPAYAGTGRPRAKGAKLPAPQQVVATAGRTRLNVAWYGGGRRDVGVVTGTGHWYKSGKGLVPVRWVYVHDLTGTHRDEYFYSTDVAMTAQQVIESYTARWNVETTFAELRACLGLETTRGRCQQTVLRAEPCLFGLYSVVALWFEQLPAERQAETGVEWEGKQGVTFSDALTAVRRWLWADGVFTTAGHDTAFAKLPEPFRQALLRALAPAA